MSLMVKYGMASDKESSCSEVTSNQVAAHPTQFGNSEGVILPITGHKLNGQNYLQWSQSLMMFVCGKGKDDQLTGRAATPEMGDPKYKIWKAKNSMVMSWLINSMTNEIGEDFMYYGLGKEIWKAKKESYSDKENLNFLKLKVLLMTFGKVKSLSHNILILLINIGNNLICLRILRQDAQSVMPNIKELLRMREFSSFCQG